MLKKFVLSTAIALSAVVIPAALPEQADAQVFIGGNRFGVGVGYGGYGYRSGYYGGYYGGYRPYYGGGYYSPYYGGGYRYGYYGPRMWRRW